MHETVPTLGEGSWLTVDGLHLVVESRIAGKRGDA
jgi:hypothetical protein